METVYSSESLMPFDKTAIWYMRTDKPHYSLIRRKKYAIFVPDTSGQNTGYVIAIFIVFPLQQWLHESASLLHYTYIGCLDIFMLWGESVYLCNWLIMGPESPISWRITECETSVELQLTGERTEICRGTHVRSTPCPIKIPLVQFWERPQAFRLQKAPSNPSRYGVGWVPDTVCNSCPVCCTVCNSCLVCCTVCNNCSGLFYCVQQLSCLFYSVRQLSGLLYCVRQLSGLSYCFRQLSGLLYFVRQLSGLLYSVRQLSGFFCVEK